MTVKATFLDPAVHRYLADHTSPPDPLLQRLIEETAELTGDRAIQQVPPEEGALLGMLTRLVGARRAIEIGTFTGYSSICIARALGRGGRLVTCDVSDEWTAVARRYWAEAGLADRIELHLVPAQHLLSSLPADERFELAFLDADKERYTENLELLLPHMRPGGLVVVDNVLWGGRVLDADDDHPWTAPIAALNDHVIGHPRLDVVMLPVADGLSLLRVVG